MGLVDGRYGEVVVVVGLEGGFGGKWERGKGDFEDGGRWMGE